MIISNIDDNLPGNKELKRIDLSNERNEIYFSKRKLLKNLMKSINSHIDNNSQTIFLTLYYMDLIFTHPDLEKIFFSHFGILNNNPVFNDMQMSDYVLLSLACLVVASKFNENDPHVPTMSSYIRLLYEYSKKKYIFNLQTLFMAEVVVVKLLKYKLNYYTIYHYLVFFFSHGIIFKKTIENSLIFKKYSEKKILEKIYIKSREILDKIIDSDKNYDLYFGKDNYFIVVEIFLWSIEHVMNIKIKDDENIFKLIFDINIPEERKKELYEIIQKLSINNKRKTNLENTSSRIILVNSKTHYYKEPTTSITNQILNKSKPTNSEMNFKYNIEPKASIISSSSFKNSKDYIQPKDIDNINNDFQISNELIHNELEKFNLNYPHQFPHYTKDYQPIIGHEYKWSQSTISYGANNRIYLNSNKNSSSKMQLSQKEFNRNNEQILKPTKNLEITPMKIEKEPFENEMSGSLYNNTHLNNIKKIILINDPSNIRKKSLSSSKNMNIPYSYNHQVRPSASINNFIEDKLNLDENINNVRIHDNKNMNNVYQLSPHNQNIETNLLEIDRESTIKKYKKSNNGFLFNKSYNPRIFNEKALTKYMNEGELLNQNGNIMNPSLQLEPQDNKRGSTNKYYINNGIKDNINKDYNNKDNTIIINNNIHINTFIDKNDLNQNDFIKSGFDKNNNNLFLFNPPNNKNTKDILIEQNSSNKYKNMRNRQKNLIELKSGPNHYNKSSLINSFRFENINRANNLKKY